MAEPSDLRLADVLAALYPPDQAPRPYPYGDFAARSDALPENTFGARWGETPDTFGARWGDFPSNAVRREAADPARAMRQALATRGFNERAAEIGNRWVEDYYQAPGDVLKGKFTPQPADQAVWSEADQEARNRGAAMLVKTAPMMALEGAGRGTAFAEPGALGAFGGRAKTAAPPTEPAAPPWYSAARQAVEGSKIMKAPAEQWAATLRNAPGVKKEELDWLGAPPEGVLTREQAAEWASRAPQVTAVTRGGKLPQKESDELIALSQRIPIDEHDAPLPSPDLTRYQELLSRDVAHSNRPEARYGPDTHPDMSLPGGENYREVLLTLPSKPLNWDSIGAIMQKRGIPGDYAPGTNLEMVADDILRYYHQRFTTDETKYLQNQVKDRGFVSSHWDEPNVLAHLRINDRDVGGKKTLFLEELQSDWHQRGRKYGYDDPTARAAIEKKLSDAGYPVSGEDARLAAADGVITPGEVRLLGNSSYVPDAPFKTTWPDLALKHAVRRAAEKGHEQVAWTPGDVQAARYDLSRQVDAIHYNPETRNLIAKNGTRVIVNEKQVQPEDLDRYVGKEAAAKILKKTPSVSGFHSLIGNDLKVGGEAMRSFYDRELVNRANALGKKYGARVEQQTLSVPAKRGVASGHEHKVHVLPITQQLRDAALRRGFPIFSAAGAGAYAAGQDSQNDALLRALAAQPRQ